MITVLRRRLGFSGLAQNAGHMLGLDAATDVILCPHPYQVDHESANAAWASADRALRSGADRGCSCLLVSVAARGRDKGCLIGKEHRFGDRVCGSGLSWRDADVRVLALFADVPRGSPPVAARSGTLRARRPT